MNVHEKPVSISVRSEIVLRPNQVTSIEPGYYENGEFGIRIENLAIVKEVETKFVKGKKFYGFEHITLVPFCRALIDVDLLTADEREWLNSYYGEVIAKVRPRLEGDDVALAWFDSETQMFK